MTTESKIFITAPEMAALLGVSIGHAWLNLLLVNISVTVTKTASLKKVQLFPYSERCNYIIGIIFTELFTIIYSIQLEFIPISVI